MKDGGGSGSAPSAGVNSLAITERQKPAPSCVASLFQMFAKRKLLSSTSKKSKLLPPGEIATKLHCSCFAPFPHSRDCANQPLSARCFSPRAQVFAWETAGRRRHVAGSQEKAPSGTVPFPIPFFCINFVFLVKLQLCSGYAIFSPLPSAKEKKDLKHRSKFYHLSFQY
jgi:hypothetical protein